jgi:DNA-binding response OmpR family regulator
MLDLVMPELGGLGLLKSLREQDVDTRVIVMTADIQEGTRQKCLALGAAAVLTKPPQAGEVRAALWQVLARAPAEDAPRGAPCGIDPRSDF